MNSRDSIGTAVLSLLLLCCFAPSVYADTTPTTLPGNSVYQLNIPLTDQHATTRSFTELRGRVRIVTMFYANCQYVCPLVIDTLKRTEAQLSESERAALAMLLVSLDPERDTPQVFAEVVVKRKLDDARWSLARTDSANVRKLAALLGIQYRQLADKEFNHSVALVLLDGEGRILAHSSKIGEPDPEFVAAVHSALSAPN